MKVLTLGPQGSNSHVAAVEYGRNIGVPEIQFTKSNYSIVETVAKNYKLYIGLVPFETTPGGLVPEIVEAIDTYRPRICGEYVLPVRHCLAWKGRWEDVQSIISHPQALRQCSKYLREYYPTMEQKEEKSTSLAAEMTSKDITLAAICTKLATEIYDLPNIIKDIQDSSENATRFMIISDKDCEKITGKDKTLLRYEVLDEPGTLHSSIGAFSKRGLNLSEQHSIATGERLGKYYQLQEVRTHRLERSMQEALRELQGLVIEGSLHIYGSYPDTQS